MAEGANFDHQLLGMPFSRREGNNFAINIFMPIYLPCSTSSPGIHNYASSNYSDSIRSNILEQFSEQVNENNCEADSITENDIEEVSYTASVTSETTHISGDSLSRFYRNLIARRSSRNMINFNFCSSNISCVGELTIGSCENQTSNEILSEREWYFYDPRLMAEGRSSRLNITTNYGGQTTYLSTPGVISPPPYEENVNANFGELDVRGCDFGEFTPPPPYSEDNISCISDPPPYDQCALSDNNNNVMMQYPDSSLSSDGSSCADSDYSDLENTSISEEMGQSAGVFDQFFFRVPPQELSQLESGSCEVGTESNLIHEGLLEESLSPQEETVPCANPGYDNMNPERIDEGIQEATRCNSQNLDSEIAISVPFIEEQSTLFCERETFESIPFREGFGRREASNETNHDVEIPRIPRHEDLPINNNMDNLRTIDEITVNDALLTDDEEEERPSSPERYSVGYCMGQRPALRWSTGMGLSKWSPCHWR